MKLTLITAIIYVIAATTIAAPLEDLFTRSGSQPPRQPAHIWTPIYRWSEPITQAALYWPYPPPSGPAHPDGPDQPRMRSQQAEASQPHALAGNPVFASSSSAASTRENRGFHGQTHAPAGNPVFASSSSAAPPEQAQSSHREQGGPLQSGAHMQTQASYHPQTKEEIPPPGGPLQGAQTQGAQASRRPRTKKNITGGPLHHQLPPDQNQHAEASQRGKASHHPRTKEQIANVHDVLNGQAFEQWNRANRLSHQALCAAESVLASDYPRHRSGWEAWKGQHDRDISTAAAKIRTHSDGKIIKNWQSRIKSSIGAAAKVINRAKITIDAAKPILDKIVDGRYSVDE